MAKYEVLQQHKGSNVHVMNLHVPQERDAVIGTFDLAEEAAKLGHDSFYRVFGPKGFVVAYSVLNGRVMIWDDVTFPNVHF